MPPRPRPRSGTAAPHAVDVVLPWQQRVLVALLLGVPVIVLPGTVENFMLGKATFLVAGAVVLVALAAARAVLTRRAGLPLAPIMAAVAAFTGALVVVTAASSAPLTSTIGVYTRYSGLASYLAYVVVFLAAVRVTDAAFAGVLMRVALVALGLVVAYGLLQAAGVEPLGFGDNGLGTTFSTMGNVDFSAAWAGAVAPAALGLAVSRAPRAWRWTAAATAPVTLGYVYVTGTSQGIVVSAVALGWAALVIATAPGSRVGRFAQRNRRGLAVAAATGAALAVTAVMLLLPTIRAQLEQALVERPAFWRAALRIFADHPMVGTGLDTFGHHFLAYRPRSHAVLNPQGVADAPHSVPLGMLSNGGLLLGLTYAAVVLLVGYLLLRRTWATRGDARLALAVFGGMWLGYQAQSLVSFDVPPLALLHWLSAGVIVALVGATRWRDITLPGPAITPRRGSKGRPVARPLAASTRGALAAIAALSLAALWVTAYPLRADLAAAAAQPLYNRQGLPQALPLLANAARLNPAEPTYVFLVARGEASVGRHREALAAAAEAAERNPGSTRYPLFAAEQAQELGDAERAGRWFRRAVSRDPLNPTVLVPAARHLAQQGQASEALRLVERAVTVRADVPGLVLLGALRAEAGDAPGARAAYEQALQLAPGQPEATEALAALSARAGD